MAAPNAVTNVAIVSASLDGSVAQLHWRAPEAGDAPTYYDVEVKVGEAAWAAVATVPFGITAYTYTKAEPDVVLDFRVTAANVDGPAAAVTTLATNVLTSTVLGDSSPSIRIALALGEYIQGVASLAQLPTSLGGDSLWGRRNEQSFPPYVPTTCLIWNHVGVQNRVTSITPNLPVSGQTRIVLENPHGRTVALEFDVAFTGTGIAVLDDADFIRVRAETATQVIITTFATAGSSTAGHLLLPSLDNYRGDAVVVFANQGDAPNGATDASYSGSGGYPSTAFGAEHELLAQMQDEVLDSASAEDLVAFVQVGGGNAGSLRGRTTDTGTRWMTQFEGDALDPGSGRRMSLFRELRRKLQDLRGQLDSDASQAGKTRIIDHVWMSFGLNDATGDFAATPRTRNVSSVSVSGATATFTVTSAIGLENGSGTRRVVRLDGFSSDTLAVNGTTQEITITSPTTFTLNDINATGLGNPSGPATAIISDPMYVWRDDLRVLTTAVRALAIAEIGSTQDPEDVPIVYTAVDPRDSTAAIQYLRREVRSLAGEIDNASVVDFEGLNRGIDLSELAVLPGELAISQPVTGTFLNDIGAGVYALTVPAGGLIAAGWQRSMYAGFLGASANSAVIAYITDVADNFLRFSRPLTVGTITASGPEATTLQRRGFQADGFFYDANGYRDLGQRIFDAKNGSRVFSIGTAKTPAIICAMAAHSYGIGTSNITFALDGDPLLLSPRATGQILPRRKVWVHDRQAIETLEVGILGPTQRANINRDPVWNRVQIDAAADFTQLSVHPSMLLSLAEQFPAEDVTLISLSKGGATLCNYSGIQSSIQSVTAETNRVIVRVQGRFITFDRPFTATIAGVTGLSPTVNGTHEATPLWGVYATTAGTQFFSIPLNGVTGTSAVGGATVSFDDGIWDPSIAGNLFDTFKTQVGNLFDHLWDQNKIPDVRMLTCMLGVNDATVGAQGQFAATVDTFVGEMREMLQTRGTPREFAQLPIVWLMPINHNDLQEPTKTNLPTIRDALQAKANADPWFSLVNVDETTAFDTDTARISDDRVHPTYRGYVDIGYRLAKAGTEGIPGWRSRHPIVATQP